MEECKNQTPSLTIKGCVVYKYVVTLVNGAHLRLLTQMTFMWLSTLERQQVLIQSGCVGREISIYYAVHLAAICTIQYVGVAYIIVDGIHLNQATDFIEVGNHS